jgi:hypothetical protein
MNIPTAEERALDNEKAAPYNNNEIIRLKITKKIQNEKDK